MATLACWLSHFCEGCCVQGRYLGLRQRCRSLELRAAGIAMPRLCHGISACHCGPDPQSMVQKAWMPDQVRHDKPDIRDDACGVRLLAHQGHDAVGRLIGLGQHGRAGLLQDLAARQVGGLMNYSLHPGRAKRYCRAGERLFKKLKSKKLKVKKLKLTEVRQKTKMTHARNPALHCVGWS